MERRRDRRLDAQLIGLVGLALADAFDLGRVQAVDLLSPLLAHALGEPQRTREQIAQGKIPLDPSGDVAFDASQKSSDPPHGERGGNRTRDLLIKSQIIAVKVSLKWETRVLYYVIDCDRISIYSDADGFMYVNSLFL
jgi:hypothetical protein